MLVSFQGFVLEEGDGFTLEDFAVVLAEKSSEDETYKYNTHFRIFLFESASDPDFHTGLMQLNLREWFEFLDDTTK